MSLGGERNHDLWEWFTSQNQYMGPDDPESLFQLVCLNLDCFHNVVVLPQRVGAFPFPLPQNISLHSFSSFLSLSFSLILQKHVLSITEAAIGLARIPRQGYDAVAQLDLPCSLMGKRAKVSFCLLCNASFAFSSSSARCKYSVI